MIITLSEQRLGTFLRWRVWKWQQMCRYQNIWNGDETLFLKLIKTHKTIAQVVSCADSFLVRQNHGIEVTFIALPFRFGLSFKWTWFQGQKKPVKIRRIPRTKESDKDVVEDMGNAVAGEGSIISCIAVCTKSKVLAICDESKQVEFSKFPFLLLSILSS